MLIQNDFDRTPEDEREIRTVLNCSIPKSVKHCHWKKKLQSMFRIVYHSMFLNYTQVPTAEYHYALQLQCCKLDFGIVSVSEKKNQRCLSDMHPEQQ